MMEYNTVIVCLSLSYLPSSTLRPL